MKTRKGVAEKLCQQRLVALVENYEESLPKTEVLVSHHLSSLNVMYADHGNTNTEFSYTQDGKGSYGVYENS